MSEETYHGIPREKISWDPKIDGEKCVACGKCVDFCHMTAYRFEEKKGTKKIAINPNRCVVFCRGCEEVCPEGAISHPSEAETKTAIAELRKQYRLR